MTEDDEIDPVRLRELQSQVAHLPRDIEPPADAWNAIRDEMRLGSRRSRSFWSQRSLLMAAAALLLVAGSSLITAIVMGRRDPVQAAVRPAREASALLVRFREQENDYIATANKLSLILEGGETQFTPETIAKLKESIRVIDAAINEAREALMADPANKQLMEILSGSYNQKVDLLRRTTEMGRS